MSTLREAAQQALEALEQCGLDDTHRSYEFEHMARIALRAALAQQEQEPVADVIRLREACDQWAEDHLQCVGEYHPDFHTVSDARFAALIATIEREACADICDQHASVEGIAQRCAEQIRARWKT